MIPFEDLIKDLGTQMGLNLKVDANESCRLLFGNDLAIQIDLASSADEILVGCELGMILPGPYRDRVFKQALRVNGQSKIPRGILAFSSKKDELILFQYLPLAHYNGEKLYQFLRLFETHARTWIDALKRGEIPQMQEESSSKITLSPFGLR